MNLRIVFAGLLSLAVAVSCSNGGAETHEHSHEHEPHDHAAEKHDHEHGEKGTEAHGADEIVLTAEKARAAGVKVETVSPGDFHAVIRTSGKITDAQRGGESVVVASVAGVVSFAEPLTEGAAVSAGEPLIYLSSAHLQDGDPVQRAYIAYDAACTDYERARRLLEDTIVSEKEFNAIKAEYERARLSYEALSENKGAAGVAICAPVGGHVKTCLVKEGDYVAVGQPLLTLTQGKGLYLRAEVSERYLPQLPSVRAAQFRTAYSDRLYSTDSLGGRLLSYGRASDATSSYIPVIFSIDAESGLLPGAFAEIYLIGEKRTGVITLPVSALTEEQGTYFVYIREDETCYRKQEVRTGATDGGRVEITSGLKGGEAVVTEGAIHVKLASASNAIPGHTHNH